MPSYSPNEEKPWFPTDGSIGLWLPDYFKGFRLAGSCSPNHPCYVRAGTLFLLFNAVRFGTANPWLQHTFCIGMRCTFQQCNLSTYMYTCSTYIVSVNIDVSSQKCLFQWRKSNFVQGKSFLPFWFLITSKLWTHRCVIWEIKYLQHLFLWCDCMYMYVYGIKEYFHRCNAKKNATCTYTCTCDTVAPTT